MSFQKWLNVNPSCVNLPQKLEQRKNGRHKSKKYCKSKEVENKYICSASDSGHSSPDIANGSKSITNDWGNKISHNSLGTLSKVLTYPPNSCDELSKSAKKKMKKRRRSSTINVTSVEGSEYDCNLNKKHQEDIYSVNGRADRWTTVESSNNSLSSCASKVKNAEFASFPEAKPDSKPPSPSSSSVSSSSSRSKLIYNSVGKLVFSKFDFSSGPLCDLQNKKKDNLKNILDKVLRDKEKVENLKGSGQIDHALSMVESLAWDRAFAKAKGVKLKDDVDKIKKTLKRKEHMKKRSKKQMAEREAGVKKAIQMRQQKRMENIKARSEAKKAKVRQKSIMRGHVIPGLT